MHFPPNFTKESPEAESLIILIGSHNVLPSDALSFSVSAKYSLSFSGGFLELSFLYVSQCFV